MKTWNDLTEKEKELNIRRLNETYNFVGYADAETAAYNVRLGYENDPDWFHFIVEDLDDFEKDVSEILRFFF